MTESEEKNRVHNSHWYTVCRRVKFGSFLESPSMQLAFASQISATKANYEWDMYLILLTFNVHEHVMNNSSHRDFNVPGAMCSFTYEEGIYNPFNKRTRKGKGSFPNHSPERNVCSKTFFLPIGCFPVFFAGIAFRRILSQHQEDPLKKKQPTLRI